MAVTVTNLSTCEKQVYTCSPKEAVIAAFAQSKNDWSTWEYEKRYSEQVIESKKTVSCGNFCAIK